MGNWADLPDELLNLLLSNLFGKDRHTFSLVCRSWNKVATTSPYRSSPCLMYYYYRTRTWKFYQYNSFFHTSFPKLENAEIRCSKYGWLLMSRHDDTLFFFDPSNNRTVELPSKIDFGYTTVCFFHRPTSPDCTVVGIQTPLCKQVVMICVLKRGEDKWETIEYSTKATFLVSHGAPVLHRGLIYFVDVKGNVARFDVNKQKSLVADYERRLVISYKCLSRRRLGSKIKEHYLFKVKGEEALFAVFVFHDERVVSVFRLSEPEMKWELVKDIGDKVLYLSPGSSFGGMAQEKSMANTIYFPKFHGETAVVYSLSDGKYHSVDGGFSDDNAYGLKRLDFATWVTPAPFTPEFTTELTWS